MLWPDEAAETLSGACWQARGILKQTALPNCYTLTKHMCEELLVGLHGAAFPVAIVRPTIIGAIARMPLPGYFGNAAGITSATLGFATGALLSPLSLVPSACALT